MLVIDHLLQTTSSLAVVVLFDSQLMRGLSDPTSGILHAVAI